jgi:hypothetical protein
VRTVVYGLKLRPPSPFASPPDALKLVKSEEAKKLQNVLLKNGAAIIKQVIAVVGLVGPIQKLAEGQGHMARRT